MFLCPVLSSYLLFLFILLPPPPTSTLFPYTTLFRSGSGDSPPLLRSGPHRRYHDGKHTAHFPAAEWDGDQRDRKSSRLNSSHVRISYAVFCLKKKKKT